MNRHGPHDKFLFFCTICEKKAVDVFVEVIIPGERPLQFPSAMAAENHVRHHLYEKQPIYGVTKAKLRHVYTCRVCGFRCIKGEREITPI